MDGLPIHEANDIPYRSTHDGRMHGCGHDGHTTMLLGAARYLAETRNFDGTYILSSSPYDFKDIWAVGRNRSAVVPADRSVPQ